MPSARCTPAALLACLCAALLSAPALTTGAEPRPYPTLVALGGAWPVDSAQGLATPVVLLDHESSGYFGTGTLSVQLATAELSVDMRHRLGTHWGVGYQLRGRKFIEGHGQDLYREGTRLDSESFRGDSFAGGLSGSVYPYDGWRASLQWESESATFSTAKRTRPDFVLPSPFHQRQLALELERTGLPHSADGTALLTLSGARRDDFQPWSLDSDPQPERKFGTQMLEVKLPLAYSGSQQGRWDLRVLNGQDLDLFSGFAMGGFAGAIPVAGYYRSEVRAEAGVLLAMEHRIRFAEDRVLSLFADAARLRRIDAEFLAGTPERQSLAGLGIGFRYGIRALRGVPVIVRYGQGVIVPEHSPERYRRELLVLVAAGF